MIKGNGKFYALFFFLIANLGLSYFIARAQPLVTSDIMIDTCSSGCFQFDMGSMVFSDTVTNPSQAVFLGDEKKHVVKFTNGYTTLGNGLNVYDARQTGGFSVEATIDTTLPLPYENIGILSFHKDSLLSGSVDGINKIGAVMPISEIDPVQSSGGSISRFSESDMAALNDASSNLEDYFSRFATDPSNPSFSQPKMIINATSVPSYFGEYHLGFGLLFTFPQHSVLNYPLSDQNYNTNLTFTVSAL